MPHSSTRYSPGSFTPVKAHGLAADERLAIRQDRSAPKVAAFKEWLDSSRSQVSAKFPTGEALKYVTKYCKRWFQTTRKGSCFFKIPKFVAKYAEFGSEAAFDFAQYVQYGYMRMHHILVWSKALDREGNPNSKRYRVIR